MYFFLEFIVRLLLACENKFEDTLTTALCLRTINRHPLPQGVF
jgi:hypothetical protein